MLMAHAGTAEKTDRSSIRITFPTHYQQYTIRQAIFSALPTLSILPGGISTFCRPMSPHCTPPKTPSPRGWKPAWESLPRGDSVLDI